MILLVFVSLASAAPVTSKVVSTHYNCSSWSSEQYPLINVLGQSHVPLIAKNDPLWKCHVDKLARFVLDSHNKYTLKTGEKLDLGQGYSLQAKQVDVEGKKVWLEFDKDGTYVDDQIVSTDSGDHIWNCELDKIQGEDNVVVLKVHVDQVFQGAVDSIAVIDGLWLIDYVNTIALKTGDQFGNSIVKKIVSGTSASNLGSLVLESYITETRITTHGTAANPEIYGNTIVWQDNRNGNWDIYIKDISTKKETSIKILGDQTNPDIYGNKVVWEDTRSGSSNIYMYDLSSKKQTKISTSGKAYNPKIYGNRIVWQDERNGNSNFDIYMYELSTKKETRITTSGSIVNYVPPAIYANKITYIDNRRGGDGDLYIFDLSTKIETRITLFEDELAIYGNRIVYHDARDLTCKIYMYDLSTKKE